MKEKIKKCYICKHAGIANTEQRTMTRIKIAGRYCYVHSDECLRTAKIIVRVTNQFTNKIKRMIHSALMKVIK